MKGGSSRKAPDYHNGSRVGPLFCRKERDVGSGKVEDVGRSSFLMYIHTYDKISFIN